MVSATANQPRLQSLSRRVGKLPTLVGEVSERITADINRGVLPPGARLPTEREMMLSLGVSRTVVREAVAQLRANGLVTTRQGLGAFVAEDALVRPLRILRSELRVIGDLIHLTELRLAVEVESAALAAERARSEEIYRIAAAIDEIDVAIERGEGGANEDFAFHREIALSTGNPHFPRMLDFLGQYIIPRKAIGSPTPDRDYLRKIQGEHRAMYDAIARRDPEGARAATRRHLSNSRERLGRMQQQDQD
jgi:DNA-binding FadR family transcriptional regulator